MVLNDHSHTYWQNKSSIAATGSGNEIDFIPTFASTSTTISGEISGDESISFIAPNSYKQTNMVRIDPDLFTIEKSTKKQHRVRINTIEGPVNAVRYNYQKEDGK